VQLSADEAVNFKLPNLKNKNIQLTELLKDGPVLLDFWATWCKPCAKALPKLNKLHMKYLEEGFQVIGINEDGPRNISKVKPFVRSLRVNFPVLIDGNGEVMRKYNVQNLPTTILIGHDGTIIAKYIGFHTKDLKKLENDIQEAIKNYKTSSTGNE